VLVSYRWLQSYVDIGEVSAEELAEKITRSGIEVETVENLNKGVTGVVVGQVLECEQHPNADKLNVCKVDIGEEEQVQIICGAPNVGKGQKVAVAKVGAVLPGNFKIKKAKLRGEASHGMICSLQELGVEQKLVPKEYAEGIFVFADDVTVGSDALDELNLNDQVLELGLTPNRADCLSMIGVAQEVAAILDTNVKKPEIPIGSAREKASDYISVSIEAKEDNPYYSAMIIKDIKVGSSPRWLVNRLVAAGIRPINNIVDITNYVLLEYGQPLHAFDYDRFGSKEVLVRRAKKGEEIVTLDDEKRTLSEEHLAITNGFVPVAAAGVMGGADSEVQNDTTTVLLEAAYFNGQTIRRASKDLGLRSESSARFEKGIARNRVYEAAQRAASLMADLAGGEVLEGIVEAGERTVDLQTVSITAQRINGVLGTAINSETIGDIFRRLGFDYHLDNDTFVVTIPSRRPDITIQEDLIEEVARLFGYDHIPTTLPIGASIPGLLSDYQKKRRTIRRYLEGAGVYQALTYSLTTPEKNQYFDVKDDYKAISLSMPMSEERSTLRTSVVPHLLDVISYNHNRQLADLAIFETASVFLTKEDTLTTLPKEVEHLAGAFTGVWQSQPWQQEKKVVDFFVVKGVLEGLFETLGISDKITFVQAKKDSLHPGRSAAVMLDEEEIGFIGQVHPILQKELDIKETYVFEVALEKLLSVEENEVRYEKLPRFPSVSRDIALVVNAEVSAGDVKNVLTTAGGDLLKEVKLFDVYEGEHLEAGKKSLAFSLRYFDPERTLTEEEVVKTHNHVLYQAEEKLGAVLRG
jgi:phenylalanyl-tRNA synthetase beta chain